MQRLMKTAEYAKWKKSVRNIKKAYHLVWNGTFENIEDQSSLMELIGYAQLKTKKQRQSFERKYKSSKKSGMPIFDDILRMRYICPVLLVGHFLEALYVWNKMCTDKIGTKVYCDKRFLLIRVGDVAYIIPKSVLVNRFWFDSEIGERLVRIALWDLINRTPEVQEYVEDRNTRESEKDNETMLEKTGMGM